MELDHAVVIVTGAAGAMGSAIAEAFAEAGARVVCVDVVGSAAVAARLRDGVAEEGDVTSPPDVARIVGAVQERYGHIDVLVNNAGIFRSVEALWEADPTTWLQDVKTNLFGPFLFCREVIPQMIKQNRGVVVNITGGGFGSAVPGGSSYTASKLAVIRLTQVLALELGDEPSQHGVRGERTDISVFGVEPAFVVGAMNAHVAASDGGRRWLPFVAQWLEAGEVRDPHDVGRALRSLVELEPRQLSGLTFSFDDDFRQLAASSEALRAMGACQARYVPPTVT